MCMLLYVLNCLDADWIILFGFKKTKRNITLKSLVSPQPIEIRDLLLDFRHHLEHTGLAPKTINSYGGAIRDFFTAVLGKHWMINIHNYRDRSYSRIKDLVPTLKELKKTVDVMNLEEEFRILFIAQTGMHITVDLTNKVGDIKRELDLENIPLVIKLIPKKIENSQMTELLSLQEMVQKY